MTIQETLRRDARFIAATGGPVMSENLLAAADRIDALEAALRNIDQAATVHTAKKIAREALGATAKEADDAAS